MNRNTNKKGFTIVELIIVIAVIAVLAAVLIPTFTGLVEKANQSADVQAVKQMNTALAVEGAAKKNDIFEVYDALDEIGMQSENYKALSKNNRFFWDAELDRVLLVNDQKKVIYPAEYEDLVYSERTWISLSMSIATVAPEDYEKGDTSVTVTRGEELAYIVEEFNNNDTADNFVIDLDGNTIDMMGAAMAMANSGDGKVTKNVTIKNGTIKNISAIDAAYVGKGGAGNNNMYYSGGLFGSVGSGAKVTIENVVVENVNIKNTHVSGAAALIASVGGEAVIRNVTVKNSTVIGHVNVGALIGNAKDSQSVTLGGEINLVNVNVKTVGGRSGLVIGLVHAEIDKINEETGLKINVTNSAYSIYECEQNTGVFEDYTLGYDEETNILYSYVYESGANELNDKKHFPDAYATMYFKDKSLAKYTGLDAYINVVPAE